MPFNFTNTQLYMSGGKKTTRHVKIRNGKGYKSICTYKRGKKCHKMKKDLSKQEIQMIKMGKFIPGLFNDISASFTKTRKNKR